MVIPNADRAIVDMRKLVDYCLSPEHPRGRHKARLFEAALGFTVAQAEDLRDALLEASRTADATPTDHDEYGQRYTLDFPIQGPTGQVTVRSAWIVRTGKDFPRLTTCFVL